MIIAFLLAFQITHASTLERERIGLGGILGEPTGLTSKFMFNNTSGIDAGVGWETSRDNEFHTYGNYPYHLYDITNLPKGYVPLYSGASQRHIYREKKEDKFGVRISLGIEYHFENVFLSTFFSGSSV